MAYLDKEGLEHLVNKIKNRIIPISKGGTGATTVADAKNNLGIKYTGNAASARGNVEKLSLAAGAITKIPLNTWDVRNNTAFTFSGNGVKCPYTGIVVVSGSVYIVSGGSSQTKGCYLQKNSKEITSQYIDSGSGAISAGTAIISVSAGDIITLNARTSAVGTVSPNNIATHLDIAYIQ